MAKLLIEVKNGIVTRVRSTDTTLHIEVIEEAEPAVFLRPPPPDPRDKQRHTILRDEYNGLPQIYP